jgi:hypothetical protein
VQVFLYASTETAGAKRLVESAKILIPGTTLEIFDSVDSISARLRSPRTEPIIMAIQVASRHELANILDLSELVNDTSLFLVLPDRRPDTVSQGLRLRPQYITYSDADVVTGAAFLKKMFDKISH